jgi:hypothetical protein
MPVAENIAHAWDAEAKSEHISDHQIFDFAISHSGRRKLLYDTIKRFDLRCQYALSRERPASGTIVHGH